MHVLSYLECHFGEGLREDCARAPRAAAAAVFLMARECEQNPGKSFKTAAVTVMTTLPTSELI